MTAADVPAVHALAEAIHVAHPERLEVFAERQRLFPAGCFVLADADERGAGAPVLGEPGFGELAFGAPGSEDAESCGQPSASERCATWTIAGYAVAHPWSGAPPALDTLLVRLPPAAAHVFVHDIAVAASARGKAHGAAAIALAVEVARTASLPELRLVAVNGTERRWASLGFEPMPDEALSAYVRGAYGAGAVPMKRARSA